MIILDIIEDAYGINLRPLLTLAENTMTQITLLLSLKRLRQTRTFNST